jgi:lipopolysaccharide transport system ATP-binding protein
MSSAAIAVERMGKRYRIGLEQQRYKTFRDSLADAVRKPFGAFGRRGRRAEGEGKPGAGDQFWALRDVSFEVKPGEVVGVVGRNGAGKSTLLKLLSRITAPTVGRATIRGRVGSLLEVGSGFHPELTGRENIFLNGAILGMRRAEVERKFDEIVAFAEIARFIDTAVKRYSSGMYMRLAFAVAAHLEPEILIVDEVLAVGDAAFQRKCLGKMGTVAKDGRTVLFVSHNMTAVQTLCSRAIWLCDGEVEADGQADRVVAKYLQANAEMMIDRAWSGDDPTASNQFVRLERARILARDPFHLTVADAFGIEFSFLNYVRGTQLNVSLHLYNLEGVCVFNSISPANVYDAGRIEAVCEIPSNFLNDGYYRVHVMIVKDTSVRLLNLAETMLFEVYDTPREYDWYGKWPGVVRPRMNWQVEFTVCDAARPEQLAIPTAAE